MNIKKNILLAVTITILMVMPLTSYGQIAKEKLIGCEMNWVHIDAVGPEGDCIDSGSTSTYAPPPIQALRPQSLPPLPIRPYGDESVTCGACRFQGCGCVVKETPCFAGLTTCTNQTCVNCDPKDHGFNEL